MTDPILSVRDLHVSFPSEAGLVEAVRGVNFDLYPKRTLCIVGESGSGKSVSSLAIMGLLPSYAKITGSVRLGEEELLGKGDVEMSEFRGKDLGMIFQDPLSALTPVFDVGTQIVEALQAHDKALSSKAAWERAVELLDLVGIPNPQRRVKAFPHEFSGGMRQRVVIAQAIANNPRVLIADEPTTALDVTIQAQILDVIDVAQQETGAGVIMITHDMGVVAGVADDVIVMYAGKPVEVGTVDEVFYEPHMPYTIGLLGSIPARPDERRTARAHHWQSPHGHRLPGHLPVLRTLPGGHGRLSEGRALPGEHRSARADPEGRHRPQRGARLRPLGRLRPLPRDRGPHDRGRGALPGARAARGRDGGDPARGAEGRPRRQGPRQDLPAGQGGRPQAPHRLGVRRQRRRLRTARGGDPGDRRRVGVGKSTTLLEIMDLGMGKNLHGSIVVDGTEVTGLGRSSRRSMRRKIQMVFQDPMGALDPRLTVKDVIAEPLKSFGYEGDVNERVGELMDLVGLKPEQKDRFPGAFSGGQRQRIGLARALATNPDIIVLDEPVSALDVSIQADVINLLEELKLKLGLSYLFVAHDLSVIRHTSDRVAVMYLGKFVETGDVEHVFDNPQHPYTQALLSAVPIPDPDVERNRKRVVLKGDLPSPTDDSPGCAFRSRCPLYLTLSDEQRRRCDGETPMLVASDQGVDHANACHYR